MTATIIGLFTGLILGLAAVLGGFNGFLIALVLGVIGLIIGRVIDGELDLGQILSGKGRNR
ncbi:MAG: hypothetical protein DLM60_22795 [Pseudonocardiales bacterium]|nr:hypothetical protein [Actinomycetota bacterium]PZS12226.1 MAG: hypothetical protein DLM60_22795 [Pseudonocardiales bacterium]